MSQPKVWLPDLLKSSAKAKKKFITNFENYDHESIRKLCLEILNKTEKIAESGDVTGLKSLNWFVEHISGTVQEDTFYDYFIYAKNDSVTRRNILVLICEHSHGDILSCLFSEEFKLLWNLLVKLQIVSLTSTDEEQHNAIYYAVRSNNIQLLDTLIHKWPKDYFKNNAEELDELLSLAYEELKLKNVLLTDETQAFVENILINLRFFHNNSNSKPLLSSKLIQSRIEVLITSIEKLLTFYSDSVDDRFLYLVKFIARNVYVLKRQLKCTYSKLPWEEIEFCLIAFVCSHSTDEDINLIYSSVLNKTKILSYLDYFSRCLKKEWNNITNLELKKLSNYPKLKREELIKNIMSIYPEFAPLYADYMVIRDIHSLKTVKKYIKLSLSANTNDKAGQLVIIRALQVCGEHFKNTVESPKLSTSTCELLLSLLPRDTRQIIIDLRNSLSHSYGLERRLEMEENADPDFFKNIINDITKINSVITEILLKRKISEIKLFLKKIVDSENSDEIKENMAILCDLNLQSILSEGSSLSLSNEFKEIEKLVDEINNEMSDKTYYEAQLLDKIAHIINVEKNKFEKVQTSYMSGMLCCLGFLKQMYNLDLHENRIRIIKFQTNITLKNMSSEVKSESLQEILLASVELISCIFPKADIINHQEKLAKLIFKLFLLAESQVGNVKWVSKLRDKLNCFESPNLSATNFENQSRFAIKKMQTQHLASKLSVLEKTLNRNTLNSHLVHNSSTYNGDKKLQVVVEMLLLDIMSIFEDSSNNLTDNLLCLDENSPVLVGKNLRNHLAHGNALCDILQNKPSVSITLNANKIISENIAQQKKKIGKLIKNDPIKVYTRYEQTLKIIEVQNSSFNALKNGNLKDMMKCIREGADVHARNIHLWTSLHFAAQGGNIQIGTFLVEQNLDVEAANKKGQTPLHIASAFGQKDMVQLLLQRNADIKVVDYSAKTPLHFAAQNGHTNVIKLLLKNKASPASTDISGCMPIHYAIVFNHREATEILLAEHNINASVMLGGFTALHVSAENGQLELVNLFLKKKANVNAKTDCQATALHTASLHGHLEVVKALISAGAQINVQTVDGGTPLHYAAENNHKTIAALLLDNGADVKAVDVLNCTPLHFAAVNGDVEMIKLLLDNKSDINHCTKYGTSSLYIAAENGHLSTVQYLVKEKASVHYKDVNGFSALHIAAQNGYADIVKLLIGSKAKVNDRDVHQRTSLHIAGFHNKPNVVATLISLGADSECKDRDGSTAIHFSCQNGRLSIVEQLIANQANLNAQNEKGLPPLFVAIAAGSIDIVKLLIKNGADVNFVNKLGLTALHVSAINGNPKMINIFIKYISNVNVPCSFGMTPLHFSVQGNHRDAVKLLIEAGASVDSDACGFTPLYFAVKSNRKEIVMDLIKHGADPNVGYLLHYSIMLNLCDISRIFINSEKCNINIQEEKTSLTPLLLAALRGQETVVGALLMKGADINFTDNHNRTSLHCAATGGHDETLKVLLKYNSKLNVRADDGSTPLHLAAISGHVKVVTTLLTAGANPNIADFMNRTSLEMAVAHNKCNIVKILLDKADLDVNEKGNDEFSLLHIAAKMGHLDITEILVEKGANMHAKNISGSKPIHIAARDGHLDIVKFYLKKNIQLNDWGNLGQSLLHYAAHGGQLEIVKYLISQNMDVNLSDENQTKPLHLAAIKGYREIIYTLLDNGAYFDATTTQNASALEIAKSHNQEKVRKLLEITAHFFHAVKHNNIVETERYLKEGAVVNVKSKDNVSPLHYASWKGYENIVNILLNYNANPNVTGKSGCTPLHYACKYNQFNIVKSLLSHKAAYNAGCSNRKTAVEFATCPNIKELLKLISESFQSVQNGNTEVISHLNRIKDKDILKTVMNTRNKDNKTLVTVAIHSDFPKLKQLKQVLQDDMCTEKSIAEALCSQERYDEALKLCKSVLENRKDLLGLEHPDTLDMQLRVGTILYKQQKYMEALKVSEDVYKTQKEVLGEENADTLRTNKLIALILHRLSKNEEALALYEQFLPILINILGPNHSDVLGARCEMALVLCALFKHEEALKVNNEIFKIQRKIDGPNNPKTLVVQNNIAMVLAEQGKHKEALELYKKVYKARKKVLGPNHSDTLRTSHWIARLTCCMKENDDADVLKEVIERQEKALGSDHFDTLTTQYNHANYLFSKQRFEESLKIYQGIIGRYKNILGDSHISVVDIERKITAIKKAMIMTGRHESSEFPQQNDAHNAPDFFYHMHTFTKEKKDNSQDRKCLTPLHYAASEGNEQLVKQLLQQGADVMLLSNKGNTALHIAASKGFDRIVDTLLEHVKNYNLPNLDDFVNAQTTNGKTSALHVAGNKNVAISLLKYGAIYNIENKNGEAPIQVSKHKDIVYLLSIIEEIFICCENGSQNLLETMSKLKPEEIEAAANAHNLDGETMFNKTANQPHIARQIKKLQRSH